MEGSPWPRRLCLTCSVCSRWCPWCLGCVRTARTRPIFEKEIFQHRRQKLIDSYRRKMGGGSGKSQPAAILDAS